MTEAPHVLVVASDTGVAHTRAGSLAASLGAAATVRVVAEAAVDSVSWAGVVVLIAATFRDAEGADTGQVPVVVDLTTVDVLDWLLEAPLSEDRAAALRDLVARGDLVLASNTRQRDILLGALAGQVRVNAAVYDQDPSLLSLVRADPDGTALAAFCRRPVRAADANLPPFVRPTKPGDLAMAMQYLRDGGPAALAARVAHRVTRLYKHQVQRRAR